MKLLLSAAAILLMTSAGALAQDTQSTVNNDAMVSSSSNTATPTARTKPTKQYRPTYDEKIEGINHDIDSSVGIEPDMDGAAGKFGAESSGGLRGGVQLQNDR